MERNMRLELKKIGNSTGLILPKDLLARLRLEQGDSVLVSEGPDGAFTVTKHDPVFDRGLEIARAGMKKYRKALTALAK
jgi:putative addiction module antidote